MQIKMKTRLLSICLLSVFALSACEQKPQQPTPTVQPPTTAVIPEPQFIGKQACQACHADQFQRWQGTHHDLAMQLASAQNVLGDFNRAAFSYNGIKTTFYREGEQFKVRTDGADGKLHDYTIKYAFGVEPLQQYLIEFDDGQVQALGIAWDSRSKEQGGQRWFHLYPGQKVDFKHELHWTRRQQNWNFMCAECHSTNLRKNYDPATNRYATSFSEINVSCEACHGPGSNHVAWAKKEAPWPALQDKRMGLQVSFDERKAVQWSIQPQTGNAQRSAPRSSRKEIDTCARCHSRRSVLNENFVHGQPIGDTHRIVVLEESLYYSDGQPRDEVYVYGSFLQSKMFHKGVTCSDCHEPHSLKLRAPKDQVCYQCHQPGKYASSQHHFHATDSKGASCVACHMPVATFMVIDPRYDHSFRVPRPDLSVKLQTPNTCNQCHADKSEQWAATQVEKWYGHPALGFQDYATILQGARQGNPAVREALFKLIQNDAQPGIARATAVSYLLRFPGRQAAELMTAMTLNNDPLIRRTAVEVMSSVAPDVRTRWLVLLLTDSVRDVRVAAARVLADIDSQQLPPEVQQSLQLAQAEYIATQQLNADRPEAHLNLGLFYLAQGRVQDAENALNAALALDANFIPASVNLADVYRASSRDAQGEALLRDALQKHGNDASLNHSLGLLLVRQQRKAEALRLLQRAATLAPDNARYRYVYAVALHSSGKGPQAISELQQVLAKAPFDRDCLWAIYAFYRERGELDKAQPYLKRLRQIEPENPELPQRG